MDKSAYLTANFETIYRQHCFVSCVYGNIVCFYLGYQQKNKTLVIFKSLVDPKTIIIKLAGLHLHISPQLEPARVIQKITESWGEPE